MPRFFQRAYRRLRFGRPIIVVSGLPRSGTSMAMKMLEAGGLEVVTDGIRTADESNPKGYYELERVKALDKGEETSWVRDARGKAIKIIAYLLPHLPDTNNYKVVFMQRDIGEVIASQNQMLVRRGEPVGDTKDDEMRRLYEQHLAKVRRTLEARPCFQVLEVAYKDAIERPRTAAERICRFVGGALDAGSMAAVADPQLYRNRR